MMFNQNKDKVVCPILSVVVLVALFLTEQSKQYETQSPFLLLTAQLMNFILSSMHTAFNLFCISDTNEFVFAILYLGFTFLIAWSNLYSKDIL